MKTIKYFQFVCACLIVFILCNFNCAVFTFYDFETSLGMNYCIKWCAR